MPQSKSSRRWLKEHFSDLYVKQAQSQGYRSRAIYKLMEIQARDKLFRKGMTVVDLGAAPGSFSQYISTLIGSTGRVFALDLLPMDSLPGVEFIQGDFTEEAVLNTLLERLQPQKADWVVSDMAPNLSGVNSVDQPRSIYLAELALELALKILRPQGGLLVKTFQGSGFENFLTQVRSHFKNVQIRKPKASRDRSREVYIVATFLKDLKV